MYCYYNVTDLQRTLLILFLTIKVPVICFGRKRKPDMRPCITLRHRSVCTSVQPDLSLRCLLIGPFTICSISKRLKRPQMFIDLRMLRLTRYIVRLLFLPWPVIFLRHSIRSYEDREIKIPEDTLLKYFFIEA